MAIHHKLEARYVIFFLSIHLKGLFPNCKGCIAFNGALIVEKVPNVFWSMLRYFTKRD